MELDRRGSSSFSNAPSIHLDDDPSKLVPKCYKEAYILLSRIEGLIGIWRDLDELNRPIAHPARAQLIYFTWSQDSIDSYRIMYENFESPPRRELWERICPIEGRRMRVHFTHSGDTVALQVLPAPISRQGSSSRISDQQQIDEIAESAAVAAGSSPGSSLGSEFVEFMASSIKKPSKSKRRRSGRLLISPLRHFSRVVIPAYLSDRHCLSGLWLSERIEDDIEPNMSATLDIMLVLYDFSGKEAMVIGTPLDGESREIQNQSFSQSWTITAASRPYVPPINLQNEAGTDGLEMQQELQYIYRIEKDFKDIHNSRSSSPSLSTADDDELELLGHMDNLVIERHTHVMETCMPEIYHEGIHSAFENHPRHPIRMYEFGKDDLRIVPQGAGGPHNFMLRDFMIRMRRIHGDFSDI